MSSSDGPRDGRPFVCRAAANALRGDERVRDQYADPPSRLLSRVRVARARRTAAPPRTHRALGTAAPPVTYCDDRPRPSRTVARRARLRAGEAGSGDAAQERAGRGAGGGPDPGAVLHVEEGDDALQLLGLHGERGRGGRHRIRGARVLLDHLVELLDRDVDLVRAGGLLARGLADVLHEVRRLQDLGDEIADEPAAPLGDGHARSGDLGDLLRGLLRALGELTDLRGDDREPPALLPRARRFDRGVQREEVRLVRDLLDDADPLGDLLHRADGARDGPTTLLRRTRRLLRDPLGGRGVLGVLPDRRVHLLYERGGLLRRRRLRRRALRHPLRARVDLPAAARDRDRRRLHLQDDVPELHDHDPHPVEEPPELVVAPRRDRDVGVARREAIHHRDALPERRGHPADEQDHAAAGHEQREEDAAERDGRVVPEHAGHPLGVVADPERAERAAVGGRELALEDDERRDVDGRPLLREELPVLVLHRRERDLGVLAELGNEPVDGDEVEVLDVPRADLLDERRDGVAFRVERRPDVPRAALREEEAEPSDDESGEHERGREEASGDGPEAEHGWVPPRQKTYPKSFVTPAFSRRSSVCAKSFVVAGMKPRIASAPFAATASGDLSASSASRRAEIRCAVAASSFFETMREASGFSPRSPPTDSRPGYLACSFVQTWFFTTATSAWPRESASIAAPCEAALRTAAGFDGPTERK